MKGIIVIWGGAIGDIPGGWHLCDGSTVAGVVLPDLRDRFIIGAGSTYGPDDSGGAVDHTHSFEGDGHVHGIPQEAGCPGAGPNPCIHTADTESAKAAGTTDSENHLPPYYALAYIIKL